MSDFNLLRNSVPSNTHDRFGYPTDNQRWDLRAPVPSQPAKFGHGNQVRLCRASSGYERGTRGAVSGNPSVMGGVTDDNGNPVWLYTIRIPEGAITQRVDCVRETDLERA